MQILLVACTRSARLVEELSRNWESLLSLLSLLTPPSLPPLPTLSLQSASGGLVQDQIWILEV